MYYDELKELLYAYIKTIKYIGYINVSGDISTKTILQGHHNNDDGVCVLKSTFGAFERYMKPTIGNEYIKIHNIGDHHVISYLRGYVIPSTVDISIVTVESMERLIKINKLKG